jgi:hypothetical protein
MALAAATPDHGLAKAIYRRDLIMGYRELGQGKPPMREWPTGSRERAAGMAVAGRCRSSSPAPRTTPAMPGAGWCLTTDGSTAAPGHDLCSASHQPNAWAMPAGNRTPRPWTTPEAASIERSASVPSSWGARPNRLVSERQHGPSVLVTVPSRRGRPAWISAGSRLATNSPDCGTDARKAPKEVEQSTAAGGRGRNGRREGQPVARDICSRGSPVSAEPERSCLAVRCLPFCVYDAGRIACRIPTLYTVGSAGGGLDRSGRWRRASPNTSWRCLAGMQRCADA